LLLAEYYQSSKPTILPVVNVSTDKPCVVLCGPPIRATGGVTTHLRTIFSSRLGESFELIHFEVGSRGRESPASDEPLWAKVLRLVTGPFTFAWLIVRRRPQIVHLNSTLDNKAFWRDAIYFLIAYGLGCSVVNQLHGGSIELMGAADGIKRRLVRWVLNKTDAVIALSNKMSSELEDQLNLHRITIIPNAVDTRDYRSIERTPFGEKITRVIYMGRIVREKGLFEAVDAIGALWQQREFSGIELLIAGSGAADSELAHYIRKRGLEKRIKLVGPVFGLEKIKFLKHGDVFLFPSYHEDLPYAILESMAAGSPVLATRVGGIPDVLTDGIHGVLVDPKNVDQIVDALRTMNQNCGLRMAMSRNCVINIEERYSLEGLARNLDTLYKAILGLSTKQVEPGDRSRTGGS
jgi:glycosyltransferase involved in cell wall biosynthesis